MALFAVTFGQKYNYEDHPILPGITGNNYITIEAENESEARLLAYQQLGSNWAFIYSLNGDFYDQIRKYDLVEYDPLEAKDPS